MGSFDIKSFLDFNPPRYLCQKCKGLIFREDTSSWSDFACPVCQVVYKQIHECSPEEHFDFRKLSLESSNTIQHCRELAYIAANFGKDPSKKPPMRSLLEAFNSASSFIHFATYGLSRTLYGALKLKAQAVSVRGIASNIDPEFAREIRETSKDAPYLELLLFEKGSNLKDWEMAPHQKVIIVDGLLAFKGTANLTDMGWRKAASGLDHVEITTDVKEVTALNNKLFSPLWREQSEEGNEINISTFPF